MLQYPDNFECSIKEFKDKIESLRDFGYHIFFKEIPISPQYQIRQMTVKSKKETENTLVLTTGLHGIEGYVGHACLMSFFEDHLPLINEHTDVVVYHIVNPYGMEHLERTNELNVDLNRNFCDSFTDNNKDYHLIKDFLSPHPMKNLLKENATFYFNLSKLIRKHGMKTLNNAVLYGQNVDFTGLYFTGTDLQISTNIMIEECNRILDMDTNITWIDIHTGYGPKYQMSIYNSKYEKKETKEMVNKLSYPRLLGLEENDIYDIQGDMIEYLYSLQKAHSHNKSFYACCYEFGTLGLGTKNSLESLRTLVYNNHIRFEETSEKIRQQVKKMMKELFLPISSKWRRKAHEDFHFATLEILRYKKLVK